LAVLRRRHSIVVVSPGGGRANRLLHSRPDPATEVAPFEALVCVRTDAHTPPDRFVAYLREEPAVVQAWRVAADIDAVVRLECTSLAELDAAVGRMRHLGGAEHTVTYLVLQPLRSGGLA
jgi:Lrp/AsnC ligand binding domain